MTLDRQAARVRGDPGEEITARNKAIRAAARRNKINWTVSTIEETLHSRERWKAMRSLPKVYAPAVYSKRDGHGKPVPWAWQTQVTAEYL